MLKAIYPGSFDPVTLGHWDLIQRAEKLVDRLVVAVLHNPGKNPAFSVAERVDFLRELVAPFPNVEVATFHGLLVDFARQQNAQCIVRGVRAFSDFEYEFQMALINRRLNRDIETVFLMTGYKWFYTSSNLIKEAAGHGGSVRGLVPEIVLQKLQAKYSSLAGKG